MHVRTNIVRSGDRAYRYTQIVQSYRNSNGQPTHKVLASFRDLPPILVENLKAAITAARDDKAVVVAEELIAAFAPPKTRANLQYLDLAVLLRVWNGWRLSELMEELLPERVADVSPAAVVAALVLHRCVAPDSKLATSRWYPTSALPELQGVSPGKFNNSRVHRVLEALEAIEPDLQRELPRRIEAERGAFVALFLDLTDTWFEGQGPDMAGENRTKEGLVRRRIGIALLCDQRGLPLRWKTLPGSYNEAAEFRRVIEELSDCPWVNQAPVIMDRTMGRAGCVEFLHGDGLRFITALPRDEFGSYSARIPLDAIGSVVVAGTQSAREKDIERARQAAINAGFVRVTDTRYVLDLGVFDKGEGLRCSESVLRAPSPDRAAQALSTARAMRRDLDERRAVGMNELGKLYECSARTVRHYLALLNLGEELQRRVLDGEAAGLSVSALRKVAVLPPDRQDAAFQKALRAKPADGTTPRGRRLRTGVELAPAPPPLRLRGVVHFNPERFVDERRAADDEIREVEAFVAELNGCLRASGSRRTENTIRRDVDYELRRRRLLSLFKVHVESAKTADTLHWHVRLTLDGDEWSRRRRTDGLNVLVAHPDLPQSAAEIVALYFAKDIVEKCFQTVKSELDLRPVHHRTDDKVRAHVTLCILALLLERTLELQLAGADVRMTAPRCLEILETCKLNLYAGQRGPVYSVTELTPDQTVVLDALNLRPLSDDALLAESIVPR